MSCRIRMLTGDEFKSGGEANLMGFDLQGSRRDFLRNIGYCPQFDSIIEVMTGREMLRLFARLRGIPSADIEGNIDKWLDFLSIQQGLAILELGNVNELGNDNTDYVGLEMDWMKVVYSMTSSKSYFSTLIGNAERTAEAIRGNSTSLRHSWATQPSFSSTSRAREWIPQRGGSSGASSAKSRRTDSRWCSHLTGEGKIIQCTAESNSLTTSSVQHGGVRGSL